MDGVENLDIYFSVNNPLDNSLDVIDLVEGGGSKLVTDQNKHEYVQAYVAWRLHARVAKQLEYLAAGFHSFIPAQSIRPFTPTQLRSVMCGDRVIDVADWKKHSVISDAGRYEHNVVEWFWEHIETLDQSDLVELLYFSTGSRSVPTGGFAQMRAGYSEFSPFRITWAPYDPTAPPLGQLPRAHTCFNQLDLPDYPTAEILREQLDFAVKNAGGGFQEFESCSA